MYNYQGGLYKVLMNKTISYGRELKTFEFHKVEIHNAIRNVENNFHACR